MATAEHTERWLPVVGYEGFYSVSDLGRVRREKSGKGCRIGAILKSSPNGTGYFKVALCRSRDDHRQFLIHRLVMAAFVGPCPDGMQVNHRNGDKSNNRLSNLEYVTPTENQAHRFDVLGHERRYYRPHNVRVGSAHQNSKLTEDQVHEIRSLYAAGGVTQRQIGDRFGIGQPTVGRIVRCEVWLHVA